MCLQIAPAVTFSAVAIALLIAHQVADHWVQSSHQAMHKGLPGWCGRRACAAHVFGYTITTTIAVVAVVIALHLPVSPAQIMLGQAVSAVTHYWADRRTTLGKLARLAGKGEFYALGAPRTGHNDNPSLGTGAYALDQSWHWAWLGVAALVTAL